MPGGLILTRHAHRPGQVCFVLEGGYRERTIDGDSMLRPGDILFHAPGEWHTNAFPSDDTLALLISVEPRRWLETSGRRPFRSAMLAAIARQVRMELTREDAASTTALEGLSLLLLSRLARLSSPVSEPWWVGEAVLRIESRFHGPISLSSLAGELGIHRATLAAGFRRFRRTSVGEHIRTVRVARASEELVRSRAPIDEIAQRTGFADQAHLGRVFKSLTGLTPGEYRRRVSEPYTSKSSK